MWPPEKEPNPLDPTSFRALDSSSDRTPKQAPRLFTPDVSVLYEDRITMASNSVHAVPDGQPVTYAWNASGVSSTRS